MDDNDLQIDLEFIENVAHQLITPLQSIRKHCKNVETERVTGEVAKKRLREVVGHVDMTILLVRRLEFLRKLIDPKSLDFKDKLGLVPFSAVVHQFIAGYNNYLLAFNHKNVKIEIAANDMNELSSVSNWQLATQQVVMNLYDNASKYCQDGSVIRITGKHMASYVEVDFLVKSKVILPNEDLERIFIRGEQSMATKPLNQSGSGLGLWICKKLMKGMNGDIRCEKGRGSSHELIFKLRWRCN